MRLVSTRNTDARSISFPAALFQGLAPDGGLYVPRPMPDISALFQTARPDKSFCQLASELAAALLGPEINPDMAEGISREAFSFAPVLREVAPGIHILELFHGPTCAFKDFGASFMASAMSRFLAQDKGKTIILTATSGDTGSAVAAAFHGKPRIEVVILYPSGRVSSLQEKQLTTRGENIFALEVNGDFDDCQRMVKAAFLDRRLKHIPLSSANSINIARLVPQLFYYAWAWNQMKNPGRFSFVVPSGNFGNITAGLYAAAWGMPTHHFVAATNSNDVVPRYLLQGEYHPRATISTCSNAMDVGTPSNFERLQNLYSQNVKIFRRHMSAESVNDETTLDTIRRVWKDFDYLCCPHTAVGWKAAEIYRRDSPETDVVILATAHPGKFLEIVKKATESQPLLPPQLKDVIRKEKNSIPIGKEDSNLRNWLLQHYQTESTPETH